MTRLNKLLSAKELSLTRVETLGLVHHVHDGELRVMVQFEIGDAAVIRQDFQDWQD